MKRILSFICLFCMVFSIIAPSAAAADNVNIIEALDYKITEKLYKETIETIYDGTYVDAKYENIPTDGYSYLLVQISVKPSTIIDADGFKVKIGNKTYNRIKDDAFLKNYDYTYYYICMIFTNASVMPRTSDSVSIRSASKTTDAFP